MKNLFAIALIIFMHFADAQDVKSLLKSKPLTVTGQSQLSVKPSLTVVSLSIKSTQPTYAGAVEELLNRMDLLTKVLKDLKFKDEEIITSNFSVNKNFTYSQGERKDNGFMATQNLSVQFDMDKKRLLEVLNKTTTSQAEPTINLSFQLDKESKSKIKAELITLAVRDAKAKASLIADEAGYTISGIQEIKYGQKSYGGRDVFMMADMAVPEESGDLSFSNFEAADLTFSDAVEIVYLIMPVEE